MFVPNDEILIFNTVTLTAAFSANTTGAYEFRSACGLTLDLVYTRNAGSASAYLEFEIEVSPDGTNWLPYGVWADSGSGVFTFTVSDYKILGSAKQPLVIDELRNRWIRFKAQETAVTSTNFGTLLAYAYPHTI